jgi:hypothetical protein
VLTGVSRRELISLIAMVPLGIAASSGIASATDDSGGTKAQLKYITTPGPNGKECAVCQLFKPPGSCAVVKGKIAPTGYCTAFVGGPK